MYVLNALICGWSWQSMPVNGSMYLLMAKGCLPIPICGRVCLCECVPPLLFFPSMAVRKLVSFLALVFSVGLRDRVDKICSGWLCSSAAFFIFLSFGLWPTPKSQPCDTYFTGERGKSRAADFFRGLWGDGKAVSRVGDGGKTALKMGKVHSGQRVPPLRSHFCSYARRPGL